MVVVSATKRAGGTVLISILKLSNFMVILVVHAHRLKQSKSFTLIILGAVFILKIASIRVVRARE